MLTMELNVGNQLFTLDYPRYPNTINLMDNPNLPVKEKFYSTDDNNISSSESDYSSYNSSTAVTIFTSGGTSDLSAQKTSQIL